jgi:hypothetical protein
MQTASDPVSPAPDSATRDVLTPWVIIRALFFSRSAVRVIASTRWSLLVGALLVFSSSLARNYDGADLLRESDVLLHGIVISTVNAMMLFALAYLAFGGREGGVPFVRGMLAFVGTFWMTAPSAWLYGIPYERFLDPLESLNANAATLALLSVWRVALASRALSVVFDVPARRAVFLVLLFSDVVLLAAMFLSPMPVIDFMGGMQQSPEERRLGEITFQTIFFGILTLPIWIILAVVMCRPVRAAWSLPNRTTRQAPRAAIAFALIAIGGWCFAASQVQHEQRHRLDAERLLQSDDHVGALTIMSSHERQDYPPQWDPPPHARATSSKPSLISEIRLELATTEHAPWVEAIFWRKAWRDARSRIFHWHEPVNWPTLTGDVPAHHIEILQLHLTHDPTLHEDERAALQEILK